MAVRQKTLRYALPLAMLAGVSGLALKAEAANGPGITSGPVSIIAPDQASATGTTGPVTPRWGSVSPLWGSVSPLWGSVSPLWGSVSPLYGSVSPQWGSVSPLWGNIGNFWSSVSLIPGGGALSPYLAGNFTQNNITPFWGTIKPYTGQISGAKLDEYWLAAGPAYQTTLNTWNAISPTATASSYGGVATNLKDMVTKAAQYWTAAVVPKGATGTFKTLFADPLMAKYGIDPTKPATLATLSPTQRDRKSVV